MRNWQKSKYLVLSGVIIISLLLVSVAFKGDEKVITKSQTSTNLQNNEDLEIFKKFVLKQIKSPFINLDYEIKKGDTIQKILKKYKVDNNEIEKVIKKYRKYGNPNQLLIGNKIKIIVKKNALKEKNSILEFSVPVSKSITISISKDEDNKIISQKVVTKLYKRKILSENVIKDNLYSSAIIAKINPGRPPPVPMSKILLFLFFIIQIQELKFV